MSRSMRASKKESRSFRTSASSPSLVPPHSSLPPRPLSAIAVFDFESPKNGNFYQEITPKDPAAYGPPSDYIVRTQNEVEIVKPTPIAPPQPPAPSTSQCVSVASSVATMAPPVTSAGAAPLVGPHASHIQTADSYLFQKQIEDMLASTGINMAREDMYRLQGVQWIQDVREALQLPVKTFTTAVIYYHKFRLSHKDTEYQYADAAAAALLCACKIEDTLKKSKDILCAAYNLKVHSSEHLSSDDAVFEGPSRSVIGLERLMFEASSFDFRARYPQEILLKYSKTKKVDKVVGRSAFYMLNDLYKTFAPLKQTTFTMGIACIKLATLILERQQDLDFELKKYYTSEGEVLETVLDLLDLYTHFQKSTKIGQEHPIETFIKLRISLNQEMVDSGLSRYTEYPGEGMKNGFKSNIKTPNTPITPASPADTRLNNKDVYSPATLSPRSAGSGRLGMGARGQDGTVRFMQDTSKAKEEMAVVDEYFKEEYEEYEVEVEEPIRQDRGPPHHNYHGHHRNDRFHNKRPRR